jgi:hypothetical protein
MYNGGHLISDISEVEISLSVFSSYFGMMWKTTEQVMTLMINTQDCNVMEIRMNDE